MRRGRNLREHRSKHLRKKVLTLAERRKQAQERLVNRKKKIIIKGPPLEVVPDRDVADGRRSDRAAMSMAERRNKRRGVRTRPSGQSLSKRDLSSIPSATPLNVLWKSYDDFAPTKHIKVCHVIESLGLGGAQTMLAELVGGLNKYYGNNTINTIVCVHNKQQKQPKMFKSYGVQTEWVPQGQLKTYLQSNNIDIVLHHRIAISKSLNQYLPEGVKYVLLNHTWNSLIRMREFLECDAYVSVCAFLDSRTNWNGHIHKSRRLVILNGIENDYINDLEPVEIAGEFKTGRCHRLVSSKFNPNSLIWMHRRILKRIPGFHHHLIGTHKEARAVAKKYDWFTYHGTVANRDKKMDIIKQFDAYFYETFSNEGASIAILEALASGVPVLAKSLGGTGEILKDGVNGFICKDRTIFDLRLSQIARGVFPHLKEKTIADFENRLHIKHAACKYVQLFESIIDA